MAKKSRRKELVVSKDRMLTVYPTLHESKEKGMLKRILKEADTHKEGALRFNLY